MVFVPRKQKRPPLQLTPTQHTGAFTLLELLVAMVITLLIAGLILGLVQSTSDIWRRVTGRASTFAAARAAFESISRSLSGATLNTYLDYYDAARETRASGDLNFLPALYGRNSDLHFVTGNNLVSGQQGGAIFFTAPLDFEEGSSERKTGGQLNGIGFFVRFGPDPTLPGFVSKNPSRYRLFQFFQPTGQLKVMNPNFPANEWFTEDTDANPPRYCYPLATNIVAFAVLPKLSNLTDSNLASLTSNYAYNTRVSWTANSQPSAMHQLPPVVRVVMVAIDDASAARIDNGSAPPDLGYDPATVFDTPSDLEESLEEISTALTARRLNFRVFSAEIPLLAAKWSL